MKQLKSHVRHNEPEIMSNFTYSRAPSFLSSTQFCFTIVPIHQRATALGTRLIRGQPRWERGWSEGNRAGNEVDQRATALGTRLIRGNSALTESSCHLPNEYTITSFLLLAVQPFAAVTRCRFWHSPGGAFLMPKHLERFPNAKVPYVPNANFRQLLMAVCGSPSGLFTSPRRTDSRHDFSAESLKQPTS